MGKPVNTGKLKIILCATIILPFLFACASEGGTKDDEARNEGCPPGRTMTCTERVGQTQECKCLTNADMEEFYDLRRDRY